MTTEPVSPPKVGAFVPARVAVLDVPPPDPGLVAALRALSGLSSAFSDELDKEDIRTVLPSTAARPLRDTDVVVGRAVTIRYLAARGPLPATGGLAHLTLFESIRPGDIAVVTSPAGSTSSILGGLAAAAAVEAGLSGLIAFAAVRDIDEILATGLPVWATTRTPSSGRSRLEAAEINGRLDAAGVQVIPGDVVVADASGIAFVPADRFEAYARRILGG
jgi:regulator of RNase E activity RraA